MSYKNLKSRTRNSSGLPSVLRELPHEISALSHVVDETIRKTRFPCKVMDKDGNVKKIIAPQEMPETSYKWDKQPYPSKRRNKNA
tara:strand:+ start:861 stop:1115 length:255 start_codon:yes stop_codon:yes gene_type:complete